MPGLHFQAMLTLGDNRGLPNHLLEQAHKRSIGRSCIAPTLLVINVRYRSEQDLFAVLAKRSAGSYQTGSAISSCGLSVSSAFALAARIRSFIIRATASNTGTATELPN